MKNFTFVDATSLDQALSALNSEWGTAQVMGGGLDLIGEMKSSITTLDKVVNLKKIGDLGGISLTATELRIGANTTLREIAEHPEIQAKFPAIAQSALAVGTPQIRNVGTLGGNLCQRPRCWYYRDSEVPCWRKGGEKCYAVKGVNTYHAILGGGPCYIVHPSDTAPALIAYNATIHIKGPQGDRSEPLERFFQLPPQNRFRENTLKPNEVVTAVTVPMPAAGTTSLYLKHEERGSWDFAVAAVAVVLKLNGETVEQARVVLGAAAPRPWRSQEAERAITGKSLSPATAEEAGKAAVERARPMSNNEYKKPLFVNMVQRALLRAAGKPI